MQNKNDFLDKWLSLTHIYSGINEKLEQALQLQYGLSLKEFYVLFFISRSEEKKLRLQQLEDMVSLSQSAISRLVVRLEAQNCGALQRHVCEDDRRGVYTRITEVGENKLQRALETFNEVLQLELQGNDRKGFQQLIQRLS
ncbi:MarR family winged helix-turn-helix transcriptional regulator [Paenibacillus pinihumi]|uniref:MarR family winged helix-turn-helix transcriptional regulator n=1 Tax=Paenibacillus pinihumi TaxID=669462 RepID=UPI000422A0D0|nr:MarR family transcriptional regulator [Paenibacillus pinihumi]